MTEIYIIETCLEVVFFCIFFFLQPSSGDSRKSGSAPSKDDSQMDTQDGGPRDFLDPLLSLVFQLQDHADLCPTLKYQGPAMGTTLNPPAPSTTVCCTTHALVKTMIFYQCLLFGATLFTFYLASYCIIYKFI